MPLLSDMRVCAMIFAYIVFLTVAVIAFFLTHRFSLRLRLAIAVAVFLIPSCALTLLVARVGDKPAPDAQTVHFDTD